MLHSTWAASQHASATQSHPPASPAPSQPPAQLTSRLALSGSSAGQSCVVTAPAGEGVDALFLPVTSCRSCLVSGGGALLLGMCNWLCLPRQYISTCFFRPSCSRGQFHDLIDICLAWQFSLPGYESKRVKGLQCHARIDGFRAVALETGCHRGLVVMWLSRSGWDVTSVTETVPETMH